MTPRVLASDIDTYSRSSGQVRNPGQFWTFIPGDRPDEFLGIFFCLKYVIVSAPPSLALVS
jgi:hypothetical protein